MKSLVLALGLAAAAWSPAGCSDKGATLDEQKGPAAATATSWPMFRGGPDLTGATDGTLPDALVLRWKFEAGHEVKSSPVVADGCVYVGCTAKENGGAVYALTLDGGAKLWEAKTDASVEAAPLAMAGMVYACDSGGEVYALDSKTGERRWTFKTDQRINSGANWMRSPTDGRLWVLVGSNDGNLYCLDAATGRKVWVQTIDGYINGTPAVIGDRIVFGGCDSRLHVLAAADGHELAGASTEVPVPGSTPVRGRLAYVANDSGKLACIDIDTAKPLWEYAPNEQEIISSPALGPEQVVFGSHDRRVHCVDARTGKRLWLASTQGMIDSSPAIAGDKVVIGSNDGRVYVLSLKDGRRLWSYEIGKDVTTSPAVASGLIVVGSDDGWVYAFGAKP